MGGTGRLGLTYIHCVHAKSLQSCLTLGTPWNTLPGSSVHGILQARILEWVAMPSSRRSSQPRMEPRSPSLQADSLCLSHQEAHSGEDRQANNPFPGSWSSSLPGSSVHEILQGVGCQFLLQGILPTQGSNAGLLHYRQILYCLSHQVSP